MLTLALLLAPATAASADDVGQPTGRAAQGAATVEETINVRVRAETEEERVDVAGVTVIVLRDDAEVTSGETGDDGVASLTVPAAGPYTVTYDPDTLPEEYAGFGSAQNPIETVVNAGSPRTVAFRLSPDFDPDAAPVATSSISWGTAPQLVAQGLRFGLILALAAIGLSLVFGTTGLTNFAHGELVTFGALVAFWLHVLVGLPLLLAAALTIVLAAGFGWLQETALWRQLRRRGTGLIAMMILSIGLAFLMRYAFLFFLSGQTLLYRDFSGQRGIDLFGNRSVLLRPSDMVSMGLAVVILLAVAFALLYTRIGKATRAVSDNPALAAASGIDVDGVIRVVWIVGTVLAALSGILLGLAQGMDYMLGFQILLLVFAAVVLGGLGTAFGAMLGALIVGLFIEVSTLFVPTELKNVGALAVLIIILLVRPQGLLGRRERVG